MQLSKKQKKRYLRSAVSMGLVVLSTVTTLVTPVMGLTTNAYAAEKKASVSKKIETKKTEKQEQAPYRNVMYYGDWSVWGGQGNQYPKDLPADTYTHLNFAFLDFDANGDLILTDKDAAFGNPVGSDNTWGDQLSGVVPALAALRKQNPNMKLGISLGGWSKSAEFATVAADATKRAHFVENVLRFIKYTGMDFVDVDWEFPGIVRDGDKVDNMNDEGTPYASEADGENFVTLMQDFRTALDKQGIEEGKTYELSVALPGTEKQLKQGGVDLEKLFQIIDFGNMMTYDMRGAWDEQSGHQTALYTNPNDPTGFSVDAVVQYLKSENVQMEKVVIGAAFYTRGWESVAKGNDAQLPGLFQDAAIAGTDADMTPSRGALNEAPLKVGDGGRRSGVWSYRSIDKLKANDPGLKEYWDDVAKAPYLYSEASGDFYTFDNERSVTEKAKYVKENNLGGMISWQSSQDKDNDGDNVRDELTRTMAKELFGSAKLPETIEDGKNDGLNVDLNIKVTSTDSGKDGYSFAVKNNEVLEAYGGDALKFADNFYSTIKKAKFIITMKDGSTLTKGDYKAGTVTAENGKTIVDLSSVYDAKYIEPGATYDFKLATENGAEVDPANVESVELQQYYDNKTMLSSNVIYGEAAEPENQKPVLSGMVNQTVNVGESFDPMAGVTAFDKEDGDLTSSIKVTGTVDTSETGTYELTYTVEDSTGAKAEGNRVITVMKEEERAPEFQGISDTTIFEGDAFDPMADVTATDAKGNDLTSEITVEGEVNVGEPGRYELTYKVASESGVEATATRVVTVEAEEAPIFSGINDKTISVGDSFDAKAGVSAIDGRGNEISSENIEVTGEVNTSEAGQYTLTYKATSQTGKETIAERVITVKEKAVDPAEEMVNPENQVMVGYWHNWDSKNDGYQRGTALAMELDEIDEAYNVVDVSFMKASESSHIPTFKPYKQTDEEFRQQVGELNAQGRSVILALGGADAHIELTQSDKDAFVAEIIKQVDKYGFDGIDIDLEQSAITAAENQTVIPAALKEVKDHYAKEGKNFLITMAPEFPYLRASGSYEPYISGLDGYYDWINPQYYNQGGDGISGENGQWLSQSDDAKKAEFLYGLTSALINGTDGHSKFVQIPADKLVIGLPSNADAAGSGYVKDPAAVQTAMERLIKDNNQIKGLMTWSVNWDNGLDASGKKYDWEFVNRYKDLIDYEGDGTSENKKPVISGVADVTLTIGDSFDPLAGVTASDSEDGDLTASIKVEGSVDTEKVGTYHLTYSVEDKEGQKVTKERTVTVQEEQAPTFSGVQAVTLTVGETFDAKAGVTAVDAFGNDVTKDIQVESNVDTSKAGNYEVTYTVKSVSGKAEAKATRKVTVKEEVTPPQGNEWDPNKDYVAGDIVTYQGKTYKAKWWTRGNEPGADQYGPWELISDNTTPEGPGTTPEAGNWNSAKVYTNGDVAVFNGKKYKAKWWTQGNEPGAEQWGPWELIG